MNTIHFSQADPRKQTVKPEEMANDDLHHHEFNTSEGSEFLDDAIRTKDQPLQVIDDDHDE